MTPQTPVQRAKLALMQTIDQACIARGELHAVDWEDEQDLRRWQLTCRHAELACERGIMALVRAIRAEERKQR